MFSPKINFSCGAVQPGDELLAIDGISLELVGGLAEVYQLLRSQNGTLRLELVPTKGEGRKRHEEDPLRRANRERWEKKNEMGNVELWHRLILQRQQQRGGIRPRAGSAFEANGQMEDGKNGGIAKQKYSEIWPKHRSASPGRKGGETKRGLKRGNPKWGYNPPKPQSTQFIHSILPNPFLRRSFSYSFHLAPQISPSSCQFPSSSWSVAFGGFD